MKILYLVPSDTTIPPPTNMIRARQSISTVIAEEIVKRGHDVSFICPRGSLINVKKIFTKSESLVGVIGKNEYYKLEDPVLRTELLSPFYFELFDTLLHEIDLKSYDLLHIHTDLPLIELVVTEEIPIPVVFTLHTSPRKSEATNTVISLFNSQKNYFISISNQQRNQFPAIKFFETVYNGLDLSNFTFDSKGDEYLLFAGRMKRLKGIVETVQVALTTKHKLKITGDMSYTDKEFLTSEFIPEVEKHSDLLQYVGFTMKLETFYKQGKALLFPIQWEEPFGLVMIEAMSCGTPVIGFARGSVPEIIKDGETGFIVNSSSDDIRGDFIIKKTGVDGLCEAVERIYTMSEETYMKMRKNAREHVEKNFTIEKMVDNYENSYKKILAKS